MNNEQVVNELIDLFCENDVEAFVTAGEAPAMTIYPDALGESADWSVKMSITPDCSEEGYIGFELLTLVAEGAYPEMFFDIYENLNQLNKHTICGTYFYSEERYEIIHRYTVVTISTGYLENILVAINGVLEAINVDIQYLEDF